MLDQEIFMQTSFYYIFGLVMKLFIGTIYLTSASVSGFCFKNSSTIHHLVSSIIHTLKWKATNYKCYSRERKHMLLCIHF